MSGWVLPDAPTREAVMTTGPSGMVLGEGPRGPVSIRLFRERGTRLVLAVPQYVSWLLAFRSISLGAHVSVIADDPREWTALVERIHAHGGTADLVGPGQPLPEAGRPYRPSLIVDDAATYEGSTAQIGSWQSVLVTIDPASDSLVSDLRTCDMGLITPENPEMVDAMRRAYFLNNRQVRACELMANDEVMLAVPRRIVKIAMRPTPTEYQLLFG
ncbi:hypothetical protein GCM10027418_31150 [Mariniluteicoccus endophyticus]